MFKPAPQSVGFDHPKGQCQTKAFLPADMNLINGATALVSITHRIKPYSSVDSMKKYSMHHDMVMQGTWQFYFLFLLNNEMLISNNDDSSSLLV